MTLMGKILTVLIFVMSLVFMGMAVTLYATHRNWREAVESEKKDSSGRPVGLKKALEEERAKTALLTTQKAEIEKEWQAEKKALAHNVTKLENENKDLTQQRDSAQKDKSQLDERLRTAVSTVKATEDTLAGMRTEIDKLREETRAATTARNEAFNNLVKKTDELHQEVVAHTNLKMRTEQLTAELIEAKKALTIAGIDMRAPTQPVVNVMGKVLGVSGADLFEISLGKDQGVMKGQQFDVFDPTAGNKYIGRGEITALDVDRAVCRVTVRNAPLKPGFIVKDVVKR